MRTPPVRPADGVVGCAYESFVPGEWPLAGEGDTVVSFSQGGAGEIDIRPARFASLCLRAIDSQMNVLPDIILSFSAGRCRQYLLLPEGYHRDERLRGPVRWPEAAECLTR